MQRGGAAPAPHPPATSKKDKKKMVTYNTHAFTEDHSVHYYRGLLKLNYEDLMGFGDLFRV